MLREKQDGLGLSNVEIRIKKVTPRMKGGTKERSGVDISRLVPHLLSCECATTTKSERAARSSCNKMGRERRILK